MTFTVTLKTNLQMGVKHSVYGQSVQTVHGDKQALGQQKWPARRAKARPLRGSRRLRAHTRQKCPGIHLISTLDMHHTPSTPASGVSRCALPRRVPPKKSDYPHQMQGMLGLQGYGSQKGSAEERQHLQPFPPARQHSRAATAIPATPPAPISELGRPGMAGALPSAHTRHAERSMHAGVLRLAAWCQHASFSGLQHRQQAQRPPHTAHKTNPPVCMRAQAAGCLMRTYGRWPLATGAPLRMPAAYKPPNTAGCIPGSMMLFRCCLLASRSPFTHKTPLPTCVLTVQAAWQAA